MGGLFSKTVILYETLTTEDKLALHALMYQNIEELIGRNPFELIWEISDVYANQRTIAFMLGSRTIVCRLEQVVDILAEATRRPFTVSFIPGFTTNNVTTPEKCRINFIQGVLPLANPPPMDDDPKT